jgi:hypothetical protein
MHPLLTRVQVAPVASDVSHGQRPKEMLIPLKSTPKLVIRHPRHLKYVLDSWYPRVDWSFRSSSVEDSRDDGSRMLDEEDSMSGTIGSDTPMKIPSVIRFEPSSAARRTPEKSMNGS